MRNILRKSTAVLLCFYLLLCWLSSAFALVTLDVYYSDSMTIGIWNTTPFIYHDKISTNESFPFVQSLVHGIQQWNPALGMFVTTTTLNTNAPIKLFGGTHVQLSAINGYNNNNMEADYGLCVVNESTWEPTGSIGVYKGQFYSTAYKYIYYNVTGFIIENSDGNINYVKTATHELGHAFGWHRHPDTYLGLEYTNWVMKQGALQNTVLQDGEKQHLGQIYPNSVYYDTD